MQRPRSACFKEVNKSVEEAWKYSSVKQRTCQRPFKERKEKNFNHRNNTKNVKLRKEHKNKQVRLKLKVKPMTRSAAGLLCRSSEQSVGKQVLNCYEQNSSLARLTAV